MTNLIKLSTNRLIIRNFDSSDFSDLHEIFSDDDVMLYVEPSYTPSQTAQFLQNFCIDRVPPGALAVELKETGKMIGYILFKPMDEPDVYETGWIFNKDYWCKGYTFEACSKLIRYGFEEMNLHKICAETIDSVKAIPLLKKLGMTQEGVQRSHTKSNDGIWHDLHWYAILADEYV